MLLYVYNWENEEEMFGAADVDVGSEVTVSNPPLSSHVREAMAGLLREALDGLS